MSAQPQTALRVVVRYLDGRVLKGTTHDFHPQRADFHLEALGAGAGRALKVDLPELKAVFFVKSFEGDRRRNKAKGFSGGGPGRPVTVKFKDGEELSGFTMGYTPDRPGFFLVPADIGGNNLRAYIPVTAVASLAWRGQARPSPVG